MSGEGDGGLHHLLRRQARRAGVDIECLPPQVALLLQRVSAAYHDNDDYRALMNRANELSSQEMTALNARIQAANDGLEEEVQRRTHELLQAKEAADASLRIKSEFLANMSHELRTPLHGMLSFAEIGERKAGSAGEERLQHYFRRVGESGEILLGLLNDLLDLAKLEAGRMHLECARAHVAPLCAAVIHEFNEACRARQLQMVLQDDAGDITCNVDTRRLMQLVRNLLGNAVKFSPAGGRITVQVQQEGDHLLLACTDEGPGIPPAELGTIFDAFVQSSATRTGAGGTGLGLSICREIATAHGGDIRARNQTGAGARFELRLPLAEAPDASEATPLTGPSTATMRPRVQHDDAQQGYPRLHEHVPDAAGDLRRER